VIARGAGAATPPGITVGLLGTVLVHGAAVALALFGVVNGVPAKQPQAYAVELVAAPAPAPKERVATEAKPAPPPEPPPAPKKVEPAKAKAPAPPPPKTQPKPVEQQTEKAPKTQAKATPAPGETPSTGTDVANIKTPGLAFAYPEYLRNIANEILRRWERPNVALRAEVSFMIMRDGSVKDIRFEKRSGNFSFDLSAQGAIEAAGNAKAFGPLPDGWEADVLPIIFVFEPKQ
jgi:outer membrane biosynthesis protein TonB